jgi:hypothetical protein
LAAEGQQVLGVLSIYLVILAINNYLRFEARRELDEAGDIFLSVCLRRLGALVENLD